MVTERLRNQVVETGLLDLLGLPLFAVTFRRPWRVALRAKILPQIRMVKVVSYRWLQG